MNQLVECVPNFSEGRNPHAIKQITDIIDRVNGVKVLHVDIGYAANRTVVTFAGKPNAVVEAAFQAIKKASEIIDMRQHNGEHPRFGAIDVCPLVPIANISMDELTKLAHSLAKRVGEELLIPVYCYEFAAKNEERRSLANCRAGEYEGLSQKLKDPNWNPDYGPVEFNAKSGAVAIGSRNYLIAYNVNLNTTSAHLANMVAAGVRESGKLKREGGKETGKIIRDENGIPLRVPGKLKKVRAIGWFIKEYDVAQVSMNLIDINTTPMHIAYETVVKSAERWGVRVTGSELIGLVPLQCLLEAGKYYWGKLREKSTLPTETELIDLAVKSMGLDELTPFESNKRIIEYLIDELSE